MSHRPPRVLPVLLVLALAACQGGGSGSSPVPSAQNDSNVQSDNAASVAAGNVSSQTFTVPETAANHVGTFVHLPLRNSAELDTLIQNQSSKDSPLYHHWLTPAQFRASYGPRLSDLQTAASALQSYGFHTTITSQGVFADAPQAVVERAFGTHLQTRTQSVMGKAVTQVISDRAPAVPAALAKLSAQVISFAPVHMQTQAMRTSAQPLPQNRYTDLGPYWFTDLKQAYQWPAFGVNRASGRTIGIIGVSQFPDSDMQLYFGHEKLPVPRIIRRPIFGGPPPFDPNSSNSLEGNLDLQQAGGSAPGATLIQYGIPDLSDATLLGAYVAVAEDNAVDVVSASIGGCEAGYDPQFNNGVNLRYIALAYHDVFRQMNSQGITFVNSSGDFGAYACSFFAPTLFFSAPTWADDPNVTGVGGTSLFTSHIAGSLRSTYKGEDEFGDPIAPGLGFPPGTIFASGGGKSVIFAKPPYQFLVNTGVATRAAPDVSLHMGGCPFISVGFPDHQICAGKRSADVEVLGGQLVGVIGTSASAPQFAGLQAIQDATLGSRAGNVNFLIYALARAGTTGNGPVFHNSIPGNNGYPSREGYNLVVGNGTVRGAEYSYNPFGPFAGDPQTPTNP